MVQIVIIFKLIFKLQKLITMSVDTNIYIPKTKEIPETIEDIKICLINGFPKYNLKNNSFDIKNYSKRVEGDRYLDFEIFYLDFKLGKEKRSLMLYYDFFTMERIYDLKVGCWGMNEDIARCLVDYFGGYADYADCDDILIDYAMPQPKKLITA